jgi:hypothetical protein
VQGSRGQRMAATNCPFKARRTPELASGALLECLAYLTSVCFSKVTAFIHGLAANLAAQIMEDWTLGVDVITLQIQVKTSHFQTLPHKLCILAHSDPGVARAGARVCMRMYAASADGVHHRMTRRFLDPSYEGLHLSHTQSLIQISISCVIMQTHLCNICSIGSGRLPRRPLHLD